MRSKIKIVILLVILLVSMLPLPSAAELQANTGLMVNNKLISDGSGTVDYNGTLMVPATELAESLGGSFSYNCSTMTGAVRQGGNELAFHLGDVTARYNGKYIKGTVPLKIINNRFMIPAEFTALKLGAQCYTSTKRNLLMAFQPINGKMVYKVMAGDTLWLISQLFGTTVQNLFQLNGLKSDMIYVDQNIIIKSFTVADNAISGYTTNNATIFSGPGFGYSAVNYLKTQTAITIIGKQGNWYKAVTPKGNGYLYYTVVGMQQDMAFGPDSTFFQGSIPVDTSMDSVNYTSYKVAKGDSIWSISQKEGIPDYELAQANGVSVYATLYPDQTLKIPVHVIPQKSVPARYGEVLDWFKEAQYIFPVGKMGRLIDLETGKAFNVKRTMGASHSDTETLTAADAEVMKGIFGGWNWSRRPFILEVDGRQFAVSVAGMPHAGVDGQPYLQNVDNRSDNYGTGPNYDSISGNGMDGHFDLYFLNCLRHVDNNYDPAHQYNVLKAGGLR